MQILWLCLIADVFLIAGPVLCWFQNDKPLLWGGCLFIGEFLAWGTFFLQIWRTFGSV